MANRLVFNSIVAGKTSRMTQGLTLKPEKPRNIRRTLMIIASIFASGCVLISVCVAFFVMFIIRITQPVVDAGNTFMLALSRADYPSAYGLMSESLQSELGSVEGFAAQMQEAGIQPQPDEWGFSSRNINDETGSVSGGVTMIDGRSFDIEIGFTQSSSGAWRINRYNFTPALE